MARAKAIDAQKIEMRSIIDAYEILMEIHEPGIDYENIEQIFIEPLFGR